MILETSSLTYTCITYGDVLPIHNLTLTKVKWAVFTFFFSLWVINKYDAYRLNKLNSVLKATFSLRCLIFFKKKERVYFQVLFILMDSVEYQMHKQNYHQDTPSF